MQDQTSVDESLAGEILNRIESLVFEAEKSEKPLEIDPFHRQLFELFVTAEAAGYLGDDSQPDLTAEGVCRTLSLRWELSDATRDSLERQTKLSTEHLAKMRMLWSIMRMWMEWSYAWQHWPEFHRGESTN